MSSNRRTVLEKSIQRDIEAELGAEPDLLLLRNSVGQAQYFDPEGKPYFVPYGLGKGSPDIVALLRSEVRIRHAGDPVVVRTGPDGEESVFAETKPLVLARWFCLEVKPEEGDLEDDQKKCHHIWRHFGAFIETVRSVQDAKRALARARRFES